MKPFPDQVRMAAFSARSCVARLTGREWPKTDDSEATLEELKATVALSIAFIEATDPAAFEDAATRRIELRFPGVELDFEGAGYLTSFAIPNFYFHVTMAYAHPAPRRAWNWASATIWASWTWFEGRFRDKGLTKVSRGAIRRSHIVRPAS